VLHTEVDLFYLARQDVIPRDMGPMHAMLTAAANVTSELSLTVPSGDAVQYTDERKSGTGRCEQD
jgi:hypothetical protein